MYATGLFIISYQFILVKIKYILFSRDKILPELNITYNNNRIKQYRTLEYLDCCPDASLSGESMATKSLRKIQSYNSCIDKMSF